MTRSIAIGFWLAVTLGAQEPGKLPSFDAASVKPADLPRPDGRGMVMIRPPAGGPGSKDPGRITYPFASLKYLLFTAYDVKDFQISGPAFLDTEHFEVSATMPPATTKEQFHLMLQNLLMERFKLAIHKETKDLPMYELTVAKGGPKLKVAEETKPGGDAAPPMPPPPPPGGPKIGADGFPDLPPIGGRAGIFHIMMPGRAKLVANRQTIQNLADELSTQLTKPVIDHTGLKEKYDFTLTFAPDQITGPMGMMLGPPPPSAASGADGGRAGGNGPAPDSEPLATLFVALQSQLGLKLEAKKGPVQLMVVDHIEKTPTEN